MNVEERVKKILDLAAMSGWSLDVLRGEITKAIVEAKEAKVGNEIADLWREVAELKTQLTELAELRAKMRSGRQALDDALAERNQAFESAIEYERNNIIAFTILRRIFPDVPGGYGALTLPGLASAAETRIERLQKENADLRHRLEAAEKQLASASPWRPIETAPRDGTLILLYPTNGEGLISTGYRHLNDDRWSAGGGWFNDGEVSHWMPISEAPETEASTWRPGDSWPALEDAERAIEEHMAAAGKEESREVEGGSDGGFGA